MKIFTKWYLVLFTVIALTWLRASDPFLIESLRLSYFDSLQRSHEQVKSDDILLIELDERSIQEYGQWPWSRETFADRLWQTDDTTINIFTIIYSEADRFNTDSIFAEALSSRFNILASAPTLQLAEGSAPHVGTATIGLDPFDYINTWPGIISPLTILSDYADGVGVTSTIPDVDGVVRTVPLVVAANDKVYPSLALETIRVAAGDMSYQIRVGEAGIEAVRIPKFETVKTLGDGSVYVSFWNQFDSISATEITPENTAGKFLIWGVTAEGVANPVATPIGAMYPHEVQANLLQTIMQGNTIVRPDFADVLELAIVFFASLIVLVLVYQLKIWFVLPAVFGFVGGIWFLSQKYWTSEYLLLDVSFPAIAILLTFSHAAFAKFIDEYLQKQAIKKQFEGYASPAVVKILQENPNLIKEGTKREVSICFTDLRGFTPLGESYGDDVKGLTQIMNAYMDAITQPVLNNNGMIIKYIGDASMHIHNAPIDDPDHPCTVVKTALEMLKAVKEFNEKLEKEGKPAVGMGAGINTGLGYLGEMGSTQRHSYDVLGDAVSTTARIESKCKEYGCDVLLGEETVKRCGDEFFFLKIDDLAVKGKSVGVGIYTVLDKNHDTYIWDKNTHCRSKRLHDEMHELYRAQDFKGAIKLLKTLRGHFHGQMNKYYDMWKERCEFMMTQKLPKDWNGVFVATSK